MQFQWTVQKWLPGIESLRGLAALAVVFAHATQQVFGPNKTLYSELLHMVAWFASTGVALFFVLSGFCIHISTVQRSSTRPNWRIYFLRRAWRILPTYYVALLVSWFVGNWTETNLLKPTSVIDLLAHITFVFPWSQSTFYSLNAVLWTIGMEVCFYLAYPVYLAMRRFVGSYQLVVLWLAIGLTIYGFASLQPPGAARFLGQHNAIVLWWQWLLGAALAETYVRGRGPTALRWSFMPIIVVVGIAVLGYVDPVIARLHVRDWTMPMLCGIGLLMVAVQSRRLCLFAGLGRFSYSLYLAHPIGIAAVVGAGIASGWGLVALLIGVSLLTGWLLFLSVERFTLKLPPHIYVRMSRSAVS